MVGKFVIALKSVYWGFPGGSAVKNPPANPGDAGYVGVILGSGRFLKEGMGTHCRILAGKIP